MPRSIRIDCSNVKSLPRVANPEALAKPIGREYALLRCRAAIEVAERRLAALRARLAQLEASASAGGRR